MSLHDDEFHIDDEMVAKIIATQMPQWAELRLQRLDTAGTVNVIYRLGDDKLVRLPRLAVYSQGPLRESQWLPKLAPVLPLQIPEYLALGVPTPEYPSAWSVLRWIQGENATPAVLLDLNRAAELLGRFVVALRAVDTQAAPAGSNRGHGLAGVDADVRRSLPQLPNDIDRLAVTEVWESCLAAPVWDGVPTWFHGDLHAGNLLARDGELVAVIDFEGSSVGDPASDLIAAWWLFEESDRDTFLDTVNPDGASIRRGMGWALSMCILAIPYYHNTNPGFADMARRALDQILSAH